jgi:hypothetical protein
MFNLYLFYINFGYNYFFKKFNFLFYLNYTKIISISKRFIYLSGFGKMEGIFNYLKFFQNIQYGFNRNNYLVPVYSNNYDFIRSQIPIYNIFFLTSFRFLYFFKYCFFLFYFLKNFIIFNLTYFFNFFLKNLFFYFNFLNFYKKYVNIFDITVRFKFSRYRLLKKLKKKKKRKTFFFFRKKRILKKKLRFLKRCFLL